MKLIPIILAGGGGTRLWPLSRQFYPKQFTSIYNEYSLLQNTLTRLDGSGLDEWQTGNISLGNPLIICNKEHRFLSLEQAAEINIKIEKLLLEPVGKNTAPALTCAALHAVKYDPECCLIMMPADHVILDKSTFQKAVSAAAVFVLDDKIVTFGIIPDRPETGYGYIKKGDSNQSDGNKQEFTGYQVDEFVEKPDFQTAVDYMESGQYLWNSGIFMMKGDTWLNAISKYEPEIFEQCSRAYNNAKEDGDFIWLDSEEFGKCKSDSIDYAVMEKLAATGDQNNTIVIPVDAGWSDIGSWSSVHENKDRNSDGNATSGDVIMEDTSNSLIISENRLVAIVGCEEMIVVETSDAVLVAGKKASQSVKTIVQKLQETQREELFLHRKVFRPWGSYESIDAGSNYQVKHLIVNPGKKLSLQMHHHRAEHWVVVKGTATVTRDTEVFDLKINESTFIPLGTKHRLENKGKEPLEVIEVQSGTYLGEDDIVRFDDDFGRIDS